MAEISCVGSLEGADQLYQIYVIRSGTSQYWTLKITVRKPFYPNVTLSGTKVWISSNPQELLS